MFFFFRRKCVFLLLVVVGINYVKGNCAAATGARNSYQRSARTSSEAGFTPGGNIHCS